MASRPITSAMLAASQGAVARPFAAVEMDFSSGFVRVNSTPYTLTLDVAGTSPAETFSGVGQLGSISALNEASELRNVSVQYSLRGIPSDLISAALGEDYQGRSCKLWFGLLDDDQQVVATPVLVRDDLMDTMDVELGKTATVTLTAQSRLARWESPSGGRYTNEEQQSRHTGDLGLEFIAQMIEKQIVWPG